MKDKKREGARGNKKRGYRYCHQRVPSGSSGEIRVRIPLWKMVQCVSNEVPQVWLHLCLLYGGGSITGVKR